jgi:hypothetical protein
LLHGSRQTANGTSFELTLEKHYRYTSLSRAMEPHRYVLPALLIGIVFMSGCAAYAGEVVYRDRGPQRTPASYSPTPRQIDRDAQAYVQHLDRHLRLDRRQRADMRQVLADRTHHLMRNTRPNQRGQVYPFPREYDRRMNSSVRRFWVNADRDLERMMSRQQREEFRWLKDRDSRDRRYDDRRDRRYDNRRPDNRRYNQAPALPPRGATVGS